MLKLPYEKKVLYYLRLFFEFYLQDVLNLDLHHSINLF